MMDTSKNKKAGVKSHLLKALFAAVFVLGLTIFVNGTDVKAATRVTVGKQTADATTAVQVETRVTAGDYIFYRVSETANFSNPTLKMVSQVTSSGTYYCNITGLSAGKSYWVQFGSSDSNVTPTNWSNAIEVVTAPNAYPTGVKHTNSKATEIEVSWNNVAGANLYVVYTQKIGSNDFDYNNGKETTTKKITIKSLAQGSAYRIGVAAVRKSSTGYTAYSEYLGTSGGAGYDSSYYPTTPKKPSKPPYLRYGYRQTGSVTATVTTTLPRYIDGYQFEIYNISAGKLVKRQNFDGRYQGTISASSKLKKNNLYRIRVRGYIKDGNGTRRYGTWSNYSYFASQKNSPTVKRATKGFKVSWKSVKGAKKYEVYMSTSVDGKYKKVATTTKKSVVVKKYGKTSLKSGKWYYFYVAPVAKSGSKYYTTNANFYGTISVKGIRY